MNSDEQIFQDALRWATAREVMANMKWRDLPPSLCDARPDLDEKYATPATLDRAVDTLRGWRPAP